MVISLVRVAEIEEQLKRFQNGAIFSLMNKDHHYLHRGIVASATIEGHCSDSAPATCVSSQAVLVVTFHSYAEMDYISGEWISVENHKPYRISLCITQFGLNNERLTFIAPIIGESGSLSLEEGE